MVSEYLMTLALIAHVVRYVNDPLRAQRQCHQPQYAYDAMFRDESQMASPGPKMRRSEWQ